MATHTQVNRRDIVSADVNTALTEFALDLLDEYRSMPEPSLVALGYQRTTGALNHKMPIAVSSPEFKKLFGDFQYRRLGELMLAVSADEWQDGVAAEAKVIESDAWNGWETEVPAMASEARLLDARVIAAAISAGETTASVENLEGGTTIKFFSASHPYDPFDSSKGTWSNLFTSRPLTLDNIDFVFEKIRTLKTANAKTYRNLRWTHVIVGPDLELTARKLFEDDHVLVQSGSSTEEVLRPNTAKKYRVTVEVSDDLTETGSWYPACVDLGGRPWVSLTQMPARPVSGVAGGGGMMDGSLGIEWIVDDKSSEMYKHGNASGPRGYVGIAAKLMKGAALTVPWRLFKCKA